MAENEMMGMTTDVEVEAGNDGRDVGTAFIGLWTVGAVAGIAAAAKEFGGPAIRGVKKLFHRKPKKTDEESNEVE